MQLMVMLENQMNSLAVDFDGGGVVDKRSGDTSEHNLFVRSV